MRFTELKWLRTTHPANGTDKVRSAMSRMEENGEISAIPGGGVRCRQLDCHCRTQRVSKIDDTGCIQIRSLPQVQQSSPGIEIRPLFRRTPFALPVSPVVEDQLVDTQQVVGPLQLPYTSSDITSIPMEPQPGLPIGAVGFGWSGDKPPMQLQAISRLERNFLVGQPCLGWIRRNVRFREENEAFFDPGPQHL